MDPSGLTSLGPYGALAAVCLGAIVGSFLNVVIARVPRGESIVSPGSHCPRCDAPIAWYDNVPIASWILLRARCRRCGEPISARYPLVEALVAAAAWAAWRRHGLTAPFLAELAFVALLVALAFVDLDTWLLPHALTWPLIALGVGTSALGLGPATLRSSLAGGTAGFAAFAAVAWIGRIVFRREALGFGDVWLLSGLGAFLGAGALLPVVLLASVQGSVVGVALVLLGRGSGAAPPEEPRPPPGTGVAVPPADPNPAPGRKTEPPVAAPPSPAARVGPMPPAAEGPGEAEPPPVQAPADEDWVPPRHAVPFGPFLAIAALEWLYLADRIVRLIPPLGTFR